jgi:asparagine synthase (glutamine-hydrolysing)
MCGINGSSQTNESLVRSMNEALIHRGPDGTAVEVGEGYTFGHNRLAIIDLSTASNQPMTSSDGRFTIVFNGEIYNFKELRTELATYNFKTNGDTEVLLAAYAAWGEGMLNKLRGIFAFALHDSADNSILLVRDQMGVKPLYYSITNGVLIFSSELTGLIAAGHKQLDTSSLAIYLSLQYVPSPTTLIKGVKKLQPGELLRFKNGQPEIETYNTEKVSERNARHGDTFEIIDSAVHRQLVSDREVGVFLSGGLDSSIVLHHARLHQSHLKTFSMGFELADMSMKNQFKFNFDMQAAKKTADHYGTSHHEFILTHEHIADHLEEALIALDEPVANATAISRYFLSEFVREAAVVVALGGDGGDEMFIGYPRHRAALAADLFQKLPHIVTDNLAQLDHRLKKLNIPLGPKFHAALVSQRPDSYAEVLKTALPVESILEDLWQKKYDSLSGDLSGAEAFIAVDRLTWLPDESLHTSDRASMAHGLEYRVPLLDLEVYEHARNFSLRQHSSYFEGKKILRSVYQDKLPRHLFGVPKKGWFSPGAKWLRNESIKKVVSEIMSDEYYRGFSGIIDWPAAQRLLDNHVDKGGYHLYPIWNLVQLQVWGRKNEIKL